MAILITNDFPPEHGGIQRLMARLAVGLADLGGEVIVVAPNVRGSAAVDAALPFRVVRYVVLRQKALGVVAMSAGLLRALSLARERVTIASIWWPVGFAVVLVPRFLRGRFVVLAHGSEIAPGRGGLRRLAMRLVYARADAVIANSSFTERLLEKAGIRKNVRRFTLGVDAREIEPRRSPEPTILSVGRLSERKGFDKVLQAVALLRHEFANVRYEIIGDGAQAVPLRALAQTLGIADRVVFRGSVNDGELWDAYARAWCFALPVRNVNDDVEGFGIVYLEAAMAGLPSIGGLNSGAVDAIEDGTTGFLVDGESVAAVTDALRTLLSDPKLCDRMGEQARTRASGQFTWRRTAEEIAACLPR